MLFDYAGRPIKTNELKKEIAAPTLAGVRTIWNNTVASGLTPDRLASVLMSAADGDHDSYLTLAEEMEERDLHYACELGKRKLAVSRLPVSVESYSDNQKDKDLADAVRDLVRKPGFKGLLKDLLDGLGKGFSVCEIMWNTSGPRWIPGQYKFRDPRFFCFDQDTRAEVRLRDETDLMNGIALQPFKFITHIPHIKSGIPIRGGIARIAAWAYMCKGYTVKDWLAFAEIFGIPFRMGKYHNGAGQEDIKILKMAVANLGSDAAAVFPESMKVELVEAAKSTTGDFFKILAEFLDNQVTKGILGQTATTQGTPGKLGNEEAQQEVRHDIRDDDAEQLGETINRDLVKPYIDLNFGPQENYPTVQIFEPDKEDIKALTSALKDLVPLGLRVEESVIRDKLGLPDPAPGVKPEELLRPESTQVIPETDQVMNRQRRYFYGMNREEDRDSMDDLVDDALNDWEPVMRPIIDPVIRAVEESETFEEFREKLAGLFDQMDITALVDSLTLSMFKARAMGDAGDEE